MTVLQTTDLATYLGVDEPTYSTRLARALNAAELVVAAELGAADFDDGASEDTLEIKTGRNVVEIKNGLLREVTEITIDGLAVDLSKVQTSYWVLAYTEGFIRGGTVIISYNHGFESAADMPAKLKEGILQVAAWYFYEEPRGHTKASESIGDYSYAIAYKADNGFVIPATAKKLIQEYAKAPT